MKHSKRLLIIIQSLLITALLSVCGMIAPLAESTFTEGDFEYAVTGVNEVMLYRYLGSDTSLNLPKTVIGMQVTGIKSGCFRDSLIESVSIPDSYTAIEKEAFYNCASLTNVTLPSKLTSLGTAAFQGCSALIGFDASKAIFLTSLPKSVLSGATSLNTVMLPAGLLEIGSNAFANSGISGINLPVNLETISRGAFMNCGNLKTINLPSYIKKISASCFSGCSTLSSAKIPKGIEEIEENAFYGCTSLRSIDLPSSVCDIGDYAFSNCTSLKDIDLPNFTTTLGQGCFKNDTGITKLFIPPTVVSIGADCFAPMSYAGTIEVKCFNDTYAYDYCYDNFVVKLVGIDRVDGDCNLDGELNIRDTTLIQKYCAGLSAIDSAAARYLADVNGDGSVTVRDATLIQMWLADIITEF